ncbi:MULTISPECIES: HEPN domain-containing protein [unclassified Sphingobium]|jgi:HEPN domain-containing protein|uniref:HEPN domain-containing protein n=1 Tax=unclassified Sphingobium TaxID=2611147 RepID=UPI000C9F2B0A|nr:MULTISPECIES: HEPN domain-containing protein [unclassified Sphingobium]PNQ03439.1 nucleotidyltransferase [Sphingobium sp. SA916]WDA35195.1 HEPN domain-containing protein [Sphingobium sp. YC-XJ3]WDA37269.1 HEPN domain-containing protein [Sphingobium sp. YC-XJ3]WDA38836.1 HEPN domain-containing protein [Sphingobium sp. YC-XJ3]
MMLRTDADHLPAPIREELLHVTTILFEAFAETTKGRCSEHYRAGRILALILHGPHAEQDWEHVVPGEAFRLLAIVNYPRLARSERDWRLVRDRLRRAWEFGEIARPVRLSVECLERVNHALVEGVPHFVTVAERGIALYQMEGLRLKTPRHLPAWERAVRGSAGYLRWHKSGSDFLAGAAFYRDQGNWPMAALLLHQACEHFYLCVLWSLTLHGPRTHALDELREAAEALDSNLIATWPRATRFERRAFGCIRRAYIEARYGRSYRISPQELTWAFGRVEILQESTVRACADYQAALIAVTSAPMLAAPTDAATTVTLPQPLQRATMLQRTWWIARRTAPSRVRWNRLIRVRRFWRSQRFAQWAERLSLAMIGLCLLLAGAEAALWRAGTIYSAQTVRSEPADPSAVLDFDVRADTVLGAVGDIANRAGYRIKANEDIWAVRWTGAYRAKATTFDALADVLYGSGLCPAIRGDTITVRYCDKSRPPRVVSIGYQTMPDGTVRMEVPR